MRSLLLLVLLSVPALAAEEPKSGPNFRLIENQPVPHPLPYDYPHCVLAITHKEHLEKWSRVYKLEPPITDQETDSFNWYVENGRGVLQHCGAKAS